MRLRVRDSFAGGGPELELELSAPYQHDLDSPVVQVAARERLDRRRVEELRDALDDFLAGRPLPR